MVDFILLGIGLLLTITLVVMGSKEDPRRKTDGDVAWYE